MSVRKNGTGIDQLQFPVTKAELGEALAKVGVIVGGDINKCIQQINELVKAYNDLRTELGGAQNQTAEIVDNLLLHVRYALEKTGGLDEAGQATEDFKQWCAKQIAEVEELKQKAIADGKWKEPVLETPAVAADPQAN